MGSHRRRAPSGSVRGAGTAVSVLSVTAAALGALPAGAAPAAPAAPHGDARTEVDRLYQEAEKATESYDRADERADALRREVHDRQDRIARQQSRVNDLRDALGSVAGAQYRSGGLDPAVALLLTDDPADYLDKAAVLDRIGAHQAEQLRDLRQALRELDQERTEATRALTELARSRAAVASHKRTVEQKLARARRLLNSLSPAERAAYARASRLGRADLPAG
ncbi:hypothetical protein ABZ651_03605, partial [Streptomyces sp. NPDC007070]